MKRLLIILIVLSTVGVSAQNRDITRSLSVIGYHVGTIALGAIGDAVYDEGNKPLGHTLKAAEVGALIGGPFIFKVNRREAVPYILSYCFLRFSFFDSFYNMTRDLPLLYNGTTSAYDNFMNQIPPHGKAWYKSCTLIVGVSIPIKYLR